MPRRNRFEDPLQEMAWRVIEVLDAGLQHELLKELATELALSAGNPRSSADKVRAAVVALREAADILGHSPSVKEYRATRVALPELKLQPDGTIRRWLGGDWNACLRRALLDAVSDGDFASRPVGMSDRYDDDEVMTALRECTSELGHSPTITEYFAWARRPDVRARNGRRPLSFKPFERFGGFRKALEAAGVLGDHEVRYSANGRVLPLRYRYRDPDISNALLMVAQRLGRSPRPIEYQRERQGIRDELLVRGETRPFPTVDVIRKRYGSWNAALREAALPPLEHPSEPHLGSVCPRYTESEKLAWIRRAWTELGEPFTANAYKRWRRERTSNATTDIPCLPTIERTFGGWQAARERALPGASPERAES